MGHDFGDGHDHITPVLADMHWLLVQYWIEYTTALITFKALTTTSVLARTYPPLGSS